MVWRNKRGGAAGEEATAVFDADLLDSVRIDFLPFLTGRRGEESAFFFALGVPLGLVFLEETFAFEALFAFETLFRLDAFAADLGFAFLAERAALRDFFLFAFF